MKYRATQKGGIISRSRAFQNILSIGYEMETSDITKLSKITDINENGETVDVFLNTDTARNYTEKLRKGVDPDSDEYNDIIARQEELLDLEVIDNHGNVDKNAILSITNDISRKRLTDKFSDICNTGDDELNSEIVKDDIYKLKLDNKLVDIHFLFDVQNNPCHVISNVEWVCTYYKPKQHGNIILDTFFNCFDNVSKHLMKLESTETELSATVYGETEIIKKPHKRLLYHLPDTNLYYLQTHYSNETPISMEDLCFVPQMTFSSKLEHLFGIMKAMSKYKVVPVDAEYMGVYSNKIYKTLVKMEVCAAELFKNVKNQQINTPKIRTLVAMMCWRLFMYYNRWLPETQKEGVYFKNFLVFNFRHSNYDIYNYLKKTIINDFGVSDKEAATLILEIFIQEPVLNAYMLETKLLKLRKGVFKKSNILERNSTHYGDPSYSLLSYFHFFEAPTEKDNIKKEENEDEDEYEEEDEEYEEEEEYEGGASLYAQEFDDRNFYERDWLVYSNADAFSARMELKDDIVLVELRHFPKLLMTYIYSIVPPELKELIANESCKHRDKSKQPIPISISVRAMRMVHEIYKSKVMKSSTRKTRKSYSKN